MHNRNWDDGWESVQEEEEGMRLGNMRTWQVWNSSFPMNNSLGMKHKLLRINAQWKNIGENRWIGHILKNIMIYTICHSVLKWGRIRSRRSLRKMLSSSGSLDFYDTEWWNANTRQKYATTYIRNCLEHAAPTWVTLISILLEPLCSQPRQGPSAFLGCGLDTAFNTLFNLCDAQ